MNVKNKVLERTSQDATSATNSASSRWKETLILAISKRLLVLAPIRKSSIRRFLYRLIFAHIGTAVEISDGAEFTSPSNIWIDDYTQIGRDVCIRRYGSTSTIRLANHVILDRGVDIRTHRYGRIEIGAHTYIGPYTCLSGDFIKIGESCLIASHSSIYANNHVFADPTRLIREQGHTYKGIIIENDCWLGSGVRIVDGVTIGEGSVIGAGAVVTKNIPPYSVAVGVPAKVISRREVISDDEAYKLLHRPQTSVTDM